MSDDLAIGRYVAAKQDVAEILWAVQRLLRQHRGTTGAQVIHPLLTRLAEDRFNLVVLGQFKRGKSSLINAIIGQDLLPTAAIPLTSAVTLLHYGATLRVQIRHEDWVLAREIAPSTLADYITERENPQNAKRVLAAEIEIPEPFLRRGLHLVDTPGIGSIHKHNTATTYRFLPEADAVIFVTSAESPLSDAETELLDTIRQQVRRVFFVLNKVDQLTLDERREVLAFVQQHLAAQMDVPSVRLFPLSARLALDGKRRGDAAAIEESGLPAFQQSLTNFLARSRGETLLVRLLDRALRILDDERKQTNLRLGASAWTAEQRKQALTDLGQCVAQFAQEARQAADEARSARLIFIADKIRPEVQAFTDQAAAKVLAGAATLWADSRDAPKDIGYQRVRAAIREQLVGDVRAWLGDHGDALDQASDEGCRELRAKLQAIHQRWSPAVATILNVTPEAIPTLALPETPDSMPSQATRRFERQQRATEEAPLYPLPEALARKLLWRRLLAVLRSEVAAVGVAVEAYLAEILAWPIEQLEHAATRAVEEARQQIEAVLLATERENEAATAVPELAERATALRDGILAWSAAPTLEPPTAVAPAGITSTVTADLVNAAPAVVAHCPICERTWHAVDDALREWQYLLATDEATRQVFQDADGFCPAHSRQLESLASIRGLSEAYLRLLRHVAREVGPLDGDHGQSASNRLAALIPGDDRCHICVVKRQAEEAAIGRLVASLNAGAPGSGHPDVLLCLPHVRAVLASDLSEAQAQGLLATLTERLDGLSSALSGYAIKIDARRRELLTPEEERALERTVALISGEGPLP